MVSQIVNAAPMVIDYGTQDLSTRALPRVPEDVPQHLPKFYLYTQKGPSEDQLVVGAERDQMYGSESFNLRGDYANYSTVFANLVNAEGNSCIIKRLIPEDAGPAASLVAYLDVLPTTVDLYERNIDGSIAINGLGDPIIAGTAPGFRVKWVIEQNPIVPGSNAEGGVGTLNITAGDQVDPVTSVQSNRYPIFELQVASQGAYGNQCGIRFWAPTLETNGSMPTKMMANSKAYPYMISVINKPDTLSTPTVKQTLFGEQSLMVTLKPNVIDPLTDARLYMGDVFIPAFQNLTDLRYPKLYGDFGQLSVYQANIDTLLGMFHAAEVPFIDSFSDFTSSPSDKGLFNFVSGVSSANVPYHSFIIVDSSTTVRFSQYTNVYAAGGSDGTMSNVTYAAQVKADVERYLDPNDELQELAVHVESIIYDTGFPLATKLALASFIGVRRDTCVVLGTHDVDGPMMTASEEHSIAIALRTRLQMYPESEYFGTPVMRGIIIGRSGFLRNSQYTGRLPLTAEIAIKSAKYMGAANGRSKNGFHFDAAPGSVVDYMYDINVTWVPASVRNRNWDVGLNWVQAYDRRSYFFPALKTVYDNDTSVLNSYFTVMAICQLNKVAHAAWREFSGVSHLTNAQLVSRVNDFVNNHVRNRFDDRYIIQPDAFLTDMDLLRGFSWTLPIKIGAPGLKSVMLSQVQAYRIEDLQTP